jgi:hypothetical protein
VFLRSSLATVILVQGSFKARFFSQIIASPFPLKEINEASLRTEKHPT